MRRVAVETADIVAGVGGLRKMRLRMTFSMAAQAAGAGLLPGMLLEYEYLRLIAAARHVVGARTVTSFTSLLCRTARLVESGLPMRRFLPGVVDFFVAGLAGFRSHILRGLGGSRSGRRCAGGLGALLGSLLAGSKGGQHK